MITIQYLRKKSQFYVLEAAPTSVVNLRNSASSDRKNFSVQKKSKCFFRVTKIFKTRQKMKGGAAETQL